MKPLEFTPEKLLLPLATIGILTFTAMNYSIARAQTASPTSKPVAALAGRAKITAENRLVGSVKPVPVFLEKSLGWLAEAQFENGGWGAGTHAHQGMSDPKAVQIDPATTAFSAMAFIRSGNTLNEGTHRRNVQKALDYLLKTVEECPEDGANITSLTGTQPQAKLGPNIDVTMCAQFLSRILPLAKHDATLEKRITQALDKCLRKIEKGQNADGSWTDGGWAPVLQSAMANSALELGEVAGRKINKETLKRSRDYQKSNLDAKTGKVKTDKAAGVSLYSITGNQRATAPEARQSQQIVDDAKQKGVLAPDAEVSVDNLVKAGTDKDKAQTLAEAYRQNEAGKRQLNDETVLAGFGNNGGEEFLSYMMSSEALVVTGGKDWDNWHNKMSRRLENIQNANGSWSGHHCITSPVFCTAAAIMTLTADRDVHVLLTEHHKTQSTK